MTASFDPGCDPSAGSTGFGGAGSNHLHDIYLTVPEADLIYSRLGHAHTGYATATHVHPYAPLSHAHDYLTLAAADMRYSLLAHTHAQGAHNHDEYLTPDEADAIYANLAHAHSQYMTTVAAQTAFLDKVEGDSYYAPLTHLHDASEVGLPPHTHDTNYYTKAQSDAKYLTPAQGDTRYYTQTAADALFISQAEADALYLTPAEGNASYAPLSHSHAYAPTSHTHDDRYFTETESNALYASVGHSHAYAPTVHTHDDRYYTEGEADGRYAASSHNHDSAYVSRSGDTMTGALAVDGGTGGAGQFGFGSINLGAGRSVDGAAFLDLIADTTYTDYGLRVIRAAGANGLTQLIARGTSGLQLRTADAGPLEFYTQALERMVILSGGNVGIGSSNPAQLLSVQKDQNALTQVEVRNNTSGVSAAASFYAAGPGGGAAALTAYDAGYTGVPEYAGYAAVDANVNTSGLALAAAKSTGMVRIFAGGRAAAHVRATFDSTGLTTLTGRLKMGPSANGTNALAAIGPQGESGTINNGANYTLTAKGMGFIFITDVVTGNGALFYCNYTTMAEIWDGANKFSPTSGAASMTNVYVSGSNIIVQNNSGAPCRYKVVILGTDVFVTQATPALEAVPA